MNDRVASAFQRLTKSAATLNTVSDELNQPIAAIEAALKALNVGVVTWLKLAGDSDDYDRFWQRDVGYAKVNGKWGLAVRTLHGFLDDPEIEEWAFNDAPRAYRLEGVDKLPDLIDALAHEADKTAQKLKTRVETTKQVAATLTALVPTAAASQKTGK